jgi:hypothetical protein
VDRTSLHLFTGRNQDRSAKRNRLKKGRKKKAANHSGRFASHSRRRVKTVPIQMKGSAMRSIPHRSLLSRRVKLSIPDGVLKIQ